MRGDTGVLSRIASRDSSLDRCAKRMRRRQLERSGPETPPLVARAVIARAYASAASLSSGDPRLSHRLLRRVIAHRLEGNGPHAFFASAASGGVMVAPKRLEAVETDALRAALDGVLRPAAEGAVPLFETEAPTPFPLFDCSANATLIGARAWKGPNDVCVWTLVDANASALRSPRALGLDGTAYQQLQRTAAHVLQLKVP